jgi:hypothetical protein
MSKQGTARWDKNSEKIYDTLKTALNKLGQPDGRVKGGKAQRSPSSSKCQFIPASAILDDEFIRLREWLNTLEELGHDTAYSALLQIWLDHHGIHWPGKVFTADMAKAGRGRKVTAGDEEKRRHCSELRSEGMDWPAIGEAVFGKATTPTEKARLGIKARDYAKTYNERVERQSPLEPRVSDLGYKMLGLERYGDVLDDLNLPRS